MRWSERIARGPPMTSLRSGVIRCLRTCTALGVSKRSPRRLFRRGNLKERPLRNEEFLRRAEAAQCLQGRGRFSESHRPDQMSAPSDVKFEIGHVLFIDIVGYSKLLINEQSEQIQKLKQIVRATKQFRLAEAEGKLLRLPTGDGGALVFRNSPEAPVLCALEISKELKSHPELHVRIGIHSGPVNEITDLNEQANIAGAGINIAQRVMNCGDAGHILLSKHVADDLEQYPQWRPQLHDLGECEVKHGARLHAVNLYTDEVGNSQVPEKFKTAWAAEKARPKSSIPKCALIGAAVLILIVVATGFLVFQVGTPLRGVRQNAVAEQGRPGGAPLPISEKSIAV